MTTMSRTKKHPNFNIKEEDRERITEKQFHTYLTIMFVIFVCFAVACGVYAKSLSIDREYLCTLVNEAPASYNKVTQYRIWKICGEPEGKSDGNGK